MAEENLHKNHRQRVRNEYLKNGAGNMDDYKILEMLLFYGIPYKDTNEIAHRLTENFHNINGVLDAPAEELQNTDGIGENTAVLLKLVRDIALRYNENKISQKTNINTLTRISDFLSMKYMGESREIVYMVSVDSHGRLEKCVKVCEGSPDSAVFDKKNAVKIALVNDMTNVILAHNHPKGFAVPSAADVASTKEIISVMRAVGINIIDHIVIAEDGSFSMAESKKYSSLFI